MGGGEPVLTITERQDQQWGADRLDRRDRFDANVARRQAFDAGISYREHEQLERDAQQAKMQEQRQAQE